MSRQNLPTVATNQAGLAAVNSAGFRPTVEHPLSWQVILASPDLRVLCEESRLVYDEHKDKEANVALISAEFFELRDEMLKQAKAQLAVLNRLLEVDHWAQLY